MACERRDLVPVDWNALRGALTFSPGPGTFQAYLDRTTGQVVEVPEDSMGDEELEAIAESL